MVAVGFAVSSVPEGLPMVVTICLACGCQDMVGEETITLIKVPLYNNNIDMVGVDARVWLVRGACW
jgi:magnesium-transporting ATPase (P-type)